MEEDAAAIVARLTGLDDVTGVWEIADRRVRSGDAAFVADLGIALWQRWGNETAPPWQYRSVSDHLLRLLTSTPGVLDPALRLIAVTIDRRGARQVASLLAAAHTAAELAPVFAGDTAEELRTCLTHELVLRGTAPPHPLPSGHPLAWLPLFLTTLEGEPHRPPQGPRMAGSRGDGLARPATETTTAAAAAAIGSAVANWAEKSNGRIEARTFALEADLPEDAVGATLLGLGLESLRDPADDPGPCTAEQAWRQLFSAASAGGAYGAAQFGAYGRLLAWRSVAALVHAPEDASVPEVEALAQASAWYSFAEAGDWFERVAWDIGLAVVAPGRRRIAVLAATDTD